MNASGHTFFVFPRFGAPFPGGRHSLLSPIPRSATAGPNISHKSITVTLTLTLTLSIILTLTITLAVADRRSGEIWKWRPLVNEM